MSNKQIHHRRVTITLDITTNVGSDDLQPHIDRNLKIWMLRGGGMNNNSVETQQSDFGNHVVTTQLSVTHEVIASKQRDLALEAVKQEITDRGA